MLLFLYCVAISATVSWARPNDGGPKNVITVPPNCPPGQEYINGACRDVWLRTQTESFLEILRNRLNQEASPSNTVTVPANCRPGQVWVNGSCRDVWRRDVGPSNVITVPPNCPEGQVYVNGSCRDAWKLLNNKLQTSGLWMKIKEFLDQQRSRSEPEDLKLENIEITNKNVINVPNHCPEGYRPDALGICRKIF